MTIGERLARARSLSGISARRLDLLAGLSRGHVTAIESGARLDVGARTVRSVADVLGISLDWLVRGTGKGPTSKGTRAAVARAASIRSRVQA